MLVLMLMLVLSVSAQKKIAILETMDKVGNVPYPIKLMVRNNLNKAISNTPGYEGYDRVDMSQIMSEQEFQRTGLVSEEQIKQLGEISGADYILVAEAALFDESNIFVTAKILNVETARNEQTENSLMGMTAQDIQHGCESLAYRLLGLPDPFTQEKTVVTTKKPEKTKVAGVKKNDGVTTISENNSKVGDIKTFPDGTQGVVFYIENGRGLAVSLTERELKWDASRHAEDIGGLQNTDENDHPFTYGQGKTNTQAILSVLGTEAEAANWCTSFGDDWYLPSSGELYYLMVTAKKGSMLFNKLSSVGAKLEGWYWSSTEHNKKEAMNVSDGGSVFTESKKSNVNVRAIRAFTE